MGASGGGAAKSRTTSRRLTSLIVGAAVVVVLLLAVFAYLLAHSQAQLRSDLDKRFHDRADVAAGVNEAIFSLSAGQAKTLNKQRFGGANVDPVALARSVQQGNQLYAEVLDSKG